MLINENNVRWLVEWCDAFEISIDGVDEETCSLVRGKGVFHKVCDRVRLIKKYTDKPISLSMVFSDKNDYLVPQFKELKRLYAGLLYPEGEGELINPCFQARMTMMFILIQNFCLVRIKILLE